MPTVQIKDRQVDVNEEGFLTDASQWDEDLAVELARQIHIDELTDDHWHVIRFLRDDHASHGETATLRRVSTLAGVPTKQLYELFPKKPAKKMAYIAGLPKPKGCV